MAIVEKSILASATPETVFRIYRDVERWNQWDPDTKASNLAGGLTLGSKGSLTPAKGSTVPMEVTSVAENRNFTVTSKTALFRMDFDHELEPVTHGTRIIHRVRFSGLLKPLLKIIVGRQVEKGLPITLKNLKDHAESMQSRSA
ncbi:MAG: SRPBCC family protein [Burkholderiaceae bacterium]